MTGQESKQTILEEAEALVSGPRHAAYDSPLDNFSRIAAVWTVLTCGRYKFEPEDVSRFMIAVKLCRQSFNKKRDNLVDIAGYARTEEMVTEEKIRRIRTTGHPNG